jgi:hypothetical protein
MGRDECLFNVLSQCFIDVAGQFAVRGNTTEENLREGKGPLSAFLLSHKLLQGPGVHPAIVRRPVE